MKMYSVKICFIKKFLIGNNFLSMLFISSGVRLNKLHIVLHNAANKKIEYITLLKLFHMLLL